MAYAGKVRQVRTTPLHEPSGFRLARRRRAARVASASVLLGIATASAGRSILHAGDEGQLLLVAGVVDGETLAPLLWLITCVCAIVLGVAGFRLFVIGYEAFTAALSAVVLCAFILAACAAFLLIGLFGLLAAEGTYTTLHELDRPAGRQVVIEDSGSSYGPTWRFYVGGPFVYDQVPESSMTTAKCTKLSTAERTTFADGEYLLTTDERGRDVLTFTTGSLKTCDHEGVPELVLPD